MSTNDEPWVEPFDPHMYAGIARDAEEDTIPLALARELRRLGEMKVWEFQAFWNHDHPSTGGLNQLQHEIATFENWKSTLLDRFPEEQFVIEQRPFHRMTWFQLLPGAPTEDDEDWKQYHEPITFNMSEMKAQLQHLASSEDKRDAMGELMRQRRLDFEAKQSTRIITDIRIHPDHRGVMIGTVEGTGEAAAISTRCIRTVIGSAPEVSC